MSMNLVFGRSFVGVICLLSTNTTEFVTFPDRPEDLLPLGDEAVLGSGIEGEN